MSNETLPIEVKVEKGDITDVVVQSWADMQRMAKAFCNSTLVPKHLQGKFEDVLVILQTAKEMNIPPLQGINGINVIQGKPSVSPELQLAMIRSNVPESYIKIEEDHAKASVSCTMAPSKDRMDESFTSTWDMPRARSMQLADKDNYKKQPMTMLKWRAIGEAARTVFPHVTRGLYNTAEADYAPAPSGPSLKDIFLKKEQTVIAEAKEIDLPANDIALEIEK